MQYPPLPEKEQRTVVMMSVALKIVCFFGDSQCWTPPHPASNSSKIKPLADGQQLKEEEKISEAAASHQNDPHVTANTKFCHVESPHLCPEFACEYR